MSDKTPRTDAVVTTRAIVYENYTELAVLARQLERELAAAREAIAAKDAEIERLRNGIMDGAYSKTGCKHENNLYAFCLACRWEEAEARLREVEAERDALAAELKDDRDIRMALCMGGYNEIRSLRVSRDALREENARLCDDLWEMAGVAHERLMLLANVVRLAGDHGFSLEQVLGTALVTSISDALARKHANAADNPGDATGGGRGEG